MIFKYELWFVAFTWSNLCLWVGILCPELKPKKPLKTKNLKNYKNWVFTILPTSPGWPRTTKFGRMWGTCISMGQRRPYRKGAEPNCCLLGVPSIFAYTLWHRTVGYQIWCNNTRRGDAYILRSGTPLIPKETSAPQFLGFSMPYTYIL